MTLDLVLWHDNIPPTFDVPELMNQVAVDYYKRKNNEGKYFQWSTFEGGPDNRPVNPDSICCSFYEQVFSRVMTDMGLEDKSRYNYTLWTQVYDSGEQHNHGYHNHYRGGCILSWVHFIEPAEEDCFCFLDSNRNRIFPKQQRKNDIIFFPSWAIHEVIPFDGKERRGVVAGNIEIDYLRVHVERVVSHLAGGLDIIQMLPMTPIVEG